MGDAKIRASLKVIDGDAAPTFECTLAEKLTIKRFLAFAAKDVAHQFARMKRERQSLGQFQELKATASILEQYLAKLLGGLDEMTVADSSSRSIEGWDGWFPMYDAPLDEEIEVQADVHGIVTAIGREGDGQDSRIFWKRTRVASWPAFPFVPRRWRPIPNSSKMV